MSDGVFAVLFALVFLLFAGISLIALMWPALFLRIFPNPFMPDTPWNRVQMRGLGLVFSLMMLMILSGISSGALNSQLVEGFADNMLLALWISFFTLPILMWFLWRFSVRSFMRRCYINGTFEDPPWERRMTLTFCSILLLIIAVALLLAAKGYHPPIRRHTERTIKGTDSHSGSFRPEG